MLLLLNLLMVGIFVSWIVSYVRIFWWVYKTTSAFKKGEPLPKMDLRRKVNFKKRIILFDGILILGGPGIFFFHECLCRIYDLFRTHCSDFIFYEKLDPK